MNEEIMNEIQPVRPKDQFTFSCRQCGACCRNIEGCVMVESLDAYRLARYLRTKGEPIEGIEDFLFRYCEPEPLTEEGFPIYGEAFILHLPILRLQLLQTGRAIQWYH